MGSTLEGSRTGTPDTPVLCNKLDRGNEGRQEPDNVPIPARQDPSTKFPRRTDRRTREGVTEPRMPRDAGRRKRRRGQNRRRRPRRNDLAVKVALKVVDGIVCE